MSEGPQVRLRAEWLHQHLAGVTILKAQTTRPDLQDACRAMGGHLVKGVSCKGKNIFIAFGGGHVLHNHLLMQGSWRRHEGQFLFLPPEAWLGLYTGTHTVCNYNGQVLRWLNARAWHDTAKAIGPDVMDAAVSDAQLAGMLVASPLPIGEALLEQSLVSGMGNVARSEALFRAHVLPGHRACDLSAAELAAVVLAAREVMWESYHRGGRWEHRVYQRTGHPCGVCRAEIRSARLAPSRRALYYCPQCQV